MTYFWISANYVPDLYMAFDDPGSMNAEDYEYFRSAGAPIRLLISVVISLTLPFIDPAEHLTGILIMGFGLHQAWSMNRRQNIAVAGPYQLHQDAPGEDADELEEPTAPDALAAPKDDPA